MSKLSKNLSVVKITDSTYKFKTKKSKKVIDAKSRDAVYEDWENLIEIIGAEKLLIEIFQQLPTDELASLVDSLKTFYEIDENIIDSKNKVTDEAWSEADHAAAFAINADDVVDLYLDGIMELEIPSGINSKEFADSCIKMCKELWSDEEVNFDYGDVEFNYAIDGNKLIITII